MRDVEQRGDRQVRRDLQTDHHRHQRAHRSSADEARHWQCTTGGVGRFVCTVAAELDEYHNEIHANVCLTHYRSKWSCCRLYPTLTMAPSKAAAPCLPESRACCVFVTQHLACDPFQQYKAIVSGIRWRNEPERPLVTRRGRWGRSCLEAVV